MPSAAFIELEFRAALELFRRGDVEQAERKLKSAAEAQPRHPGVINLLGALLASQGRHREAEPILRAATRLPPVSAATYFNYGLTLQNIGRPRDALDAFDKAIAKNPMSADAWFGRGSILIESGEYKNAIVPFDRALAIAPDYFLAHHNKGNALLMLRRHSESALSQDACLRINPSFAPAHLGRARALSALRQFDLALASLATAASLSPDLAKIWETRGEIYLELRRYDEAIESFRKALSLTPASVWLQNQLVLAKLKACDWSTYQSDFEALRSAVRSGASFPPGLVVSFPFSAAEQFHNATARLKSAGVHRKGPSPNARADSQSRIRLAYLSAELREHATAYLLVEVLERHDRSRFEITVLNNRPRDDSPLQKRVIDAVDHFVDVFDLDDERLVEQIRALQIDILVNLDASNEQSRGEVFARRPAPVQVNYLGFPGTGGAPAADYLIADRTVIPPDSKRYYLEKIVYLPGCYQPNDSKRVIGEPPRRRSEVGLPEGRFVFCCFNGNEKIAPETFDDWSRILLATPGAVLWLLHGNPAAVANLRKAATARGVDPERLVFAKRLPFAEHLARHRLADLFLDTLPYNAHTTASDALRTGLPVLTRIGEAFAGRVAASLLEAVGLPELVVATREDYVATAIDLAADPERLSALKAKLERNLPTASLFDAKLYATRLDAAFAAMHARRLAHRSPEDIEVPA